MNRLRSRVGELLAWLFGKECNAQGPKRGDLCTLPPWHEGRHFAVRHRQHNPRRVAAVNAPLPAAAAAGALLGALAFACARPAIADDHAISANAASVPVAVNAPASPTPQPARTTADLENVLLLEQVVDVAQTQWMLAQNGKPYPCSAPGRTGCHLQGVRELDPLATPFVHSPWVNLASAIAMNGAVRLVPDGRTKRTLLRVTIGLEGLNLGRNAFVMVTLSK